MLKAHKKAIRRAAVNTFGYIAKAIGPQDVLHTLLNNLKVQERQNRVCTTVAIGIVAETCAPFTVLPALLNEYRVPELNVQNGVLKALSFMFEYIGEMGKDYVYAVTPLLEDALMDRDLVHRQTACAAVKHLTLGVAGLGCEDALQHLMNYVWPNIFETSPHVIANVFEAIEAFAVALGPGYVLNYVLQGLYHPARRVREVYWKIYNTLYIYGADALTQYYPALESDETNSYQRTYMEVHWCLRKRFQSRYYAQSYEHTASTYNMLARQSTSSASSPRHAAADDASSSSSSSSVSTARTHAERGAQANSSRLYFLSDDFSLRSFSLTRVLVVRKSKFRRAAVDATCFPLVSSTRPSRGTEA